MIVAHGGDVSLILMMEEQEGCGRIKTRKDVKQVLLPQDENIVRKY